MNESHSGGPGGGYQSRPGGRRQPDHWPDDDWNRLRPGQERGPDPREASGERGRQRYAGHRRPELDQTTVDQFTAVDRAVVDQTAALDPQGREAGRNRPLINLNWALISRNWALIGGLVFFLIDTFLMADGFARPVAMASRVLVTFIWLISLAAVALLWLRGSSRFSIQNPFVRAETGAHQR
jgi:hypothetical protein